MSAVLPIADLSAMRVALRHYLRELWSVDVPLLPIDVSVAGTDNATVTRPFLSNLGMHLPRATAAAGDPQARALYFAAAAHAGAHLAYSRHRHPRAELRPIQLVLAGLLEDARVEWLAMRALPGLRALWLPFHDTTPGHGGDARILLRRLARALIDPAYRDPHPWVEKGMRFFFEACAHGQAPLHDPAMLRKAASLLGNDIGQMRLQFNAKTYLIEPAYRDDNANLWLPGDEEEPPPHAYDEDDMPAVGARAAAPPETAQPDARRHDDKAGQEASGRFTRTGEEVRTEIVDDIVDPSVIEVRYPEWDRLIGAYRHDWTRVLERPAQASPNAHDAATARPSLTRRSASAATHSQARRLRAQADGERLDIDALVRARIDKHLGQAADWRVWTRARRHRPSLDVLLLLDQSASTQGRALDLIKTAALGSALALEEAGDRCAIDGFCSDGRSRVHYARYKDFDQPPDSACRARLDGMQSRYSTRMGAALRHAAAQLAAPGARRPTRNRGLVLLITDGEPHDIDVFDRQYLIDDAKQAVKEARSRHVATFCISLDRDADRYVSRIFGRHGYLCVNRVETLLARLPQVCRQIAG